MTGADPKSLSPLGFLTVVQHPQHGLFGGYLVLNPAGRPLEFHCTAPVKPNRAQQILYGPTLDSYLYGEQIAHTLVSKAKTEVSAVLTDVEPVLAVRQFLAVPAVLVVGCGGSKEDIRPVVHGPHTQPAAMRLHCFQVGSQALAVAAEWKSDVQSVSAGLQAVADRLDLAEPFGRIRDAVTEAQRAA